MVETCIWNQILIDLEGKYWLMILGQNLDILSIVTH